MADEVRVGQLGVNHEGAIQLVAPDHERNTAEAGTATLQDLEILKKERDLLEKEARRLALEVVELQNGHRQLIATREFLLRQLDKQQRKRRRRQSPLLRTVKRALALLAKATSRFELQKKKQSPLEYPKRICPQNVEAGHRFGAVTAASVAFRSGLTQCTPVAVVVHAFYPELLPEILAAVRAAGFEFDLFVSCPEHALPEIHSQLGRLAQTATLVRVVPNRGRDIAPFLGLLPEIGARGYSTILKLHTKRSVHLEDGDCWRTSLLDTLLAPASAQAALETLRASDGIGIVGPRAHILPLRPYTARNLAQVRKLAVEMGATTEPGPDTRFIAGSMFYARIEALLPLLRLRIDGTDFEPEVGQIDGTLAHAVERLFVVSAQLAGYRLGFVGADEDEGPGGRPVTAAPYRFGMIDERVAQAFGSGTDGGRRTVA